LKKGVSIVKKHQTATSMSQDRLSFLWLVIGFALSLFVSIRWSIPVAAWLASVFMLRFARTQSPIRGLPWVWLATFATIALTSQGTLPSGLFYFLFAAGTALAATFPYLVDRLVAPHLGGFLATLVFPLAWTSYEYLTSLIGPFGTIGSIAYTQYGNLPLLQIVSVTGIWGISFLITWLAPIVNWAWEREFVWPKVRGGILLYSAILTVILLGGGARLAFTPPVANTVRLAGISPSRTIEANYDQLRRSGAFDALFLGKATDAQRTMARTAYAKLTDDLFMRTEQEAKAGTKIFLWPEAGTSVLQEDETALLKRGSTLTQKYGIYLEMGLIIVTSKAPFAENKALLIAPTGEVILSYYKAHPVPGEPWLPGDGRVANTMTPYGRLATVICFDADFPALPRQAGQAGADLMLRPAHEWQEIDPFHAQIATFRAIENGFSLVSEAEQGRSIAVDYEGRVLASSDAFTSDAQVMVALVPTKGVDTIYAILGDLFAWLCIAGLVIFICVAVIRRQTGTTDGQQIVQAQEQVLVE
jgi:apolipoprotein N-acyltransferase